MTLNKNKIKIINYTEKLSDPIKILNYEWLEKYFKVEEGDILSLSNPKKYIIDKGGFIYYAVVNNEIMGTVSLLKKSYTTYKLGKMAVTEKVQGLGVGKLLLEHCLSIAKQKK